MSASVAEARTGQASGPTGRLVASGKNHPRGGQGHGPAANPFRQPRAVWAVAFACVVSFMGIGLVDPILPSLAGKLHATPAQVELLFTSYLVVTAVAMLVTGWVSSRIGAKRTLVAGLVLIVVFSALDRPIGRSRGSKISVSHWLKKGSDFDSLSECVRGALGENLERVKSRLQAEEPAGERAGS